ncbi:unnamed protein product [Protopolystoma xenopodis]|uniref:Uncharacterized protein n=1 Tax=Protopolystoma xenopodis TaxID=117903 RepID=A0A3S5AZ10_9PLAT|nr:unnamed protein product [Protopolystoma xenopodis]
MGNRLNDPIKKMSSFVSSPRTSPSLVTSGGGYQTGQSRRNRAKLGWSKLVSVYESEIVGLQPPASDVTQAGLKSVCKTQALPSSCDYPRPRGSGMGETRASSLTIPVHWTQPIAARLTVFWQSSSLFARSTLPPSPPLQPCIPVGTLTALPRSDQPWFYSTCTTQPRHYPSPWVYPSTGACLFGVSTNGHKKTNPARTGQHGKVSLDRPTRGCTGK